MTYTVKQKIEMVVTFKGSFEFTKQFGWKTEYITINKFEDADGNAMVWKTGTGTIAREYEVPFGKNGGTETKRELPNNGAKIKIKGTVKALSEYKGVPQVELTRVKLVEIVEQTKTWEEIQDEKKEAQLKSIGENDLVWRMPYRQYKEHYADCETIIGSYEFNPNCDECPKIEVIIRDGRLKASGVRGKSFRYYRVFDDNNKVFVAKAVCEENALKQAKRACPESNWIGCEECR